MEPQGERGQSELRDFIREEREWRQMREETVGWEWRKFLQAAIMDEREGWRQWIQAREAAITSERQGREEALADERQEWREWARQQDRRHGRVIIAVVSVVSLSMLLAFGIILGVRRTLL